MMTDGTEYRAVKMKDVCDALERAWGRVEDAANERDQTETQDDRDQLVDRDVPYMSECDGMRELLTRCGVDLDDVREYACEHYSLDESVRILRATGLRNNHAYGWIQGWFERQG